MSKQAFKKIAEEFGAEIKRDKKETIIFGWPDSRGTMVGITWASLRKENNPQISVGWKTTGFSWKNDKATMDNVRNAFEQAFEYIELSRKRRSASSI